MKILIQLIRLIRGKCIYCGEDTIVLGEGYREGYWDENTMGKWRECIICKKQQPL